MKKNFPYSIGKFVKERASELLNLIYPKICLLCGCDLLKHESSLCRNCTEELPYTNFHLQHPQKIDQLFWGRVEVERATAILKYTKGGNVQTILKTFKYRDHQKLAFKMGEIMGHQLQNSQWFNDIDILIPVPLHPKKLKERGYNQSELLAQGISNVTGKAFKTDLLKRAVHTSTQTKKNRYERYMNIDGVFSLVETGQHRDNHFLLVDDVITTGSTLEGCIHQLKKIEGARISVATLAYADD